MDKLGFWKLRTMIRIKDAADLMVGMEPGRYEAAAAAGADLSEADEIKYKINFRAAKLALIDAVRAGEVQSDPDKESLEIKTDLKRISDEDLEDFDDLLVSVRGIQNWIKGCGVRDGFFVTRESPALPYLDKSGRCYSPKLAAAIEAWSAISAMEVPRGKTVKKMLIAWVQSHASQFGLCDDAGVVNKQGLEEVVKVANWEVRGGAPHS